MATRSPYIIKGTQQGMFPQTLENGVVPCFHIVLLPLKENSQNLIQFDLFGSFSWIFQKQKTLGRQILFPEYY